MPLTRRTRSGGAEAASNSLAHLFHPSSAEPPSLLPLVEEVVLLGRGGGGYECTDEASENEAAEDESWNFELDEPPPPPGNRGILAVLRSPMVVRSEKEEAVARGDPEDEAKEESEVRLMRDCEGPPTGDGGEWDREEAETADPRRRMSITSDGGLVEAWEMLD